MTEQNSDPDPLAGARELIAAGIPVFVAPPSGDPAKGAAGFRLPMGWEHTRPDPNLLDRWKPGWAVGAVMGHGLDLLDVDPRNGGDESLASLRDAGLIPRVYASASTPSGGRHLFVASLGVRSRDGVRPGLDVKAGIDGTGHGFAFIAPTVKVSKAGPPLPAHFANAPIRFTVLPSLHPYEWEQEPDAEHITTEAPGDDTGAELARIVTEAHSGVTTAPRGDGLVGPARFGGPWDDIPGELSRGRHKGVHALASALRGRDGWRVDDAVAYMSAVVWPQIDQTQGGHPYSWAEFDHDVRDVFDRYPEGHEEPDDEASEDPLTRVRNGAWLDAQVFPPLQWAVPGLVPEGFGLLVGAPKLGKSWWALGAGLAVASGGNAFGKISVPQRPVLYAALEDGDRRMQDRARSLLVGAPIPASFEYFTRATPGEIFAIVSTWLDRRPGGLVMLDTLGKVMPPALSGETTYQRDYRIGGAIKSITDDHRGSTGLVVHHNRKAVSADWMESTSGTNGLNGSADFTVYLTRERNSDRATVNVTGRDVLENEYAMTAAGGMWRLDGENLAEAAKRAAEEKASAGLGDDSASVVEYVNQNPAGVTLAKVAAHMGWDDKKAGTYLGRLVGKGRIARAGRGRYTPVESVGSVESDGADDDDSTLPTLPTPPVGEGDDE